MIRRTMLAVGAALLALLVVAPALAGGWAVVTIDRLPQQVHAGERVQIGFSIRQHGRDLVSTDWEGHPLKPVLHAQLKDAPSGLSFPARQSGAAGHFVADVTLPTAGAWAWSISAPPFLIHDADAQSGALAFEPLLVLPAREPLQTPPAQLGAAAPAAWLAGNRLALRGAGAALLALAAGALLLGRRTADRRSAAGAK